MAVMVSMSCLFTFYCISGQITWSESHTKVVNNVDLESRNYKYIALISQEFLGNIMVSISLLLFLDLLDIMGAE